MRGSLILFGIIILVIGLLPFFKRFVNIPFLPTEGAGYSVMITLAGALATIIGLFGFQGVIKPKLH